MQYVCVEAAHSYTHIWHKELHADNGEHFVKKPMGKRRNIRLVQVCSNYKQGACCGQALIRNAAQAYSLRLAAGKEVTLMQDVHVQVPALYSKSEIDQEHTICLAPHGE